MFLPYLWMIFHGIDGGCSLLLTCWSQGSVYSKNDLQSQPINFRHPPLWYRPEFLPLCLFCFSFYFSLSYFSVLFSFDSSLLLFFLLCWTLEKKPLILKNLMPKFLKRSLVIFIIKSFRTIIFIVISTTFRPICPPAFCKCLSNSGTFTELRTMSFIESTGFVCSDSVRHNWVKVLNLPVLLHACRKDWTCNLQMIVSLEALGTNAMCPAGLSWAKFWDL